MYERWSLTGRISPCPVISKNSTGNLCHFLYFRVNFNVNEMFFLLLETYFGGLIVRNDTFIERIEF